MMTSGISFAGPQSQFVRNFGRNNERVAVAVEQLSTGKRINRPSDDPTGFVAAEAIRGELIDLRSEQKAATYRRVNFSRQQARDTYSRPVAKQTQPANVEQPINVDPSEDLLDTSEQAIPADSSGRIDQIFDHFREDKIIVLTEALSQIEDTDFAVATAELVQGQILSRASMAALAYANQQATDQMTILMSELDATVG